MLIFQFIKRLLLTWRNLRKFDHYLSEEIRDFRKAELVAKRKGYGMVIIHNTACHDSYSACQATFRSFFFPEKMNGEQKLMACFIQIVNRAIHRKEKSVDINNDKVPRETVNPETQPIERQIG